MGIERTFGKRWIEALLSGKFEQGASRTVSKFGDQRTYCCLGVGLCVAGQDPASFPQRTTSWRLGDGHNIGDYIPGLTQKDASRLAAENDHYGLSFKAIAGSIEDLLDPEVLP